MPPEEIVTTRITRSCVVNCSASREFPKIFQSSSILVAARTSFGALSTQIRPLPRTPGIHQRRIQRRPFDAGIRIPFSKRRERLRRAPASDSGYVQECWRKALERRAMDPEGAITAARSLLESVCKHILDETGSRTKTPKNFRNCTCLVAGQLNLSPSQHAKQVFKQILGSCQSVVEGLGALRNRLSDAHGKGKAGVRPAPRHAELA